MNWKHAILTCAITVGCLSYAVIKYTLPVNSVAIPVLIKPENQEKWRQAHKEAQQQRKTALGKKWHAHDMRIYGDQKASARVTTMVHDALQRAQCPVTDVPVYSYTAKGGLTSGSGIWIDENLDEIELIYTCTHEAGHWYHLHAWEDLRLNPKNTPIDTIERQADEFALHYVAPEIRASIIARAHYNLNPVDLGIGGDEDFIALLKPEIIHHADATEYLIPNSGDDYSRNIVSLANQYPHLALA